MLGNPFCGLPVPDIDSGDALVVDLPSQLKRSMRVHTRDCFAEQSDHLLIRMATAVIDNHSGFQVIAGAGVLLFDRFWDRRRKRCLSHNAAILPNLVPDAKSA